MNINHIHVTWCDRDIGYAIIPKISRDSGENFDIYGFCIFFEGKSMINYLLLLLLLDRSIKRIVVVLACSMHVNYAHAT